MIYRRLTVRTCAAYAALVLPIIVGVSSLVFFSRLLSDVAANALPPLILGNLLLLTLVKYAPQLLLLCFFAGIFLTMRQFFQRHEMDAWHSAGIGLVHFIAPALTFVLPGAFFVAVFALQWSPWSVHQLNVVRTTAAFAVDVHNLPRDRFTDLPEGAYTYYYGDRDIFLARNDNLAHEIILVNEVARRDEQVIQLMDGRLFRLFSQDGEQIIESMQFDDMHVSLPGNDAIRQSPRAKSVGQLNWQTPADRAELIWRLNLPVAALILALLALCLAPAHPRYGSRHGYLSAIAVFFLYLNLLRYVKGQMEQEALSAAAAMVIPPLFMLGFVVAVMSLFRRQ